MLPLTIETEHSIWFAAGMLLAALILWGVRWLELRKYIRKPPLRSKRS